MKAFQWLLKSFIVILIVSIVGACGSKTTAPAENSTPNNSGNEPKAAEPAEQEKVVTLDYWIINGNEANQVIELMKQWNADNPNTQVNAQSIPGSPDEYFQKLSAAFASGKGPDMFSMSPTEFMKYIDSGIAYPLDKWIQPNASDYYEQSLDAVTVNGKIYATPANMDLLALYYNKELLEKEGVQPPKTWSELIEAAKKLTTKDRYGMLIETNQGGYQNFEFYPFIWMTGNDILSKDQKQVTVNNEGTRKAFQLYRDLINSGGVSKKVETGGWDISYLATGKAAMQLSGSWNIAALRNDYPDFKYGVVPYPAPEAGAKSSSDAGGWKFMVSSKGQDPDRAAAVLDWLTNQDIARPLSIVKASSKFSPRKSVIEGAGDYYKEFPLDIFTRDILPIAGMEPAFSGGVVKAFEEALQEAMFTEKSMDDIVKNLEAKAQKALK
jgi:multiple sugar transport system substrate-binding protein